MFKNQDVGRNGRDKISQTGLTTSPTWTQYTTVGIWTNTVSLKFGGLEMRTKQVKDRAMTDFPGETPPVPLQGNEMPDRQAAITARSTSYNGQYFSPVVDHHTCFDLSSVNHRDVVVYPSGVSLAQVFTEIQTALDEVEYYGLELVNENRETIEGPIWGRRPGLFKLAEPWEGAEWAA